MSARAHVEVLVGLISEEEQKGSGVGHITNIKFQTKTKGPLDF